MGWIQGQTEQEGCTELHFTDIIIRVCSLISVDSENEVNLR